MKMLVVQNVLFIFIHFQIFAANTDRNTAVISTFPSPVFARIVRITCLTRHGINWQMRFEILGCKQ